MILAPLWLWALPLVALPVLVHLILRRRTRAIVLPTLMFLARVDPRHKARRRLRELLLLALRMLVVALAILALARVEVGGLGGGPAAVVVLMDTSASMALPASEAPEHRVFDEATAGAGALLAALGSEDAVAVLAAVPDPRLPDPSGLVRDRAAARRSLDALRPSDAAVRPVAALRRAGALLAASTMGRRELHLFTDAQAGEWTTAVPVDLLPAGTRVVVHVVTAAVPDALPAITAVGAPERLAAGRPLALRVTLGNAGRSNATVAIQAEDQAHRTVQVAATVPAGGTAAVPVVLPGADPGERLIRLRLEGAAGPGTEAAVVVLTEAPRGALLVGGRAALGALAPALDPSGDGRLSGVLGRTVTEPTPGPQDAVVAAPWDTAGLARLSSWVAAGGTLVLVPPVKPGASLPAFTGITAGEAITTAQALIAPDAGQPLVHDLVTPEGTVDLGGARVLQATTLAGGHVVLATADGRPVVVDQPQGLGRVVVFGMAWRRTATDLPTKPASLVLAQALAAPVAANGARALMAGEVPRQSGGPVRLLAPDGTVAWQGPAASLPAPDRAGVWTVLAEPAVRLAVRADPTEAIPRWCAPGHCPALDAFTPEVRALRVPAEAAKAGTLAGRTALAPWLVLLALVALAVETWIARPREARS